MGRCGCQHGWVNIAQLAIMTSFLRLLHGMALPFVLLVAGFFPGVPGHAGPLRDAVMQRQLSPATAGHTLAVALPHVGRQRSFLLHVPRSYQPGQPLPLVLALHGGGGNMAFMANDRHYGLISHSDQARYLLAVPNGTGALGDKLATWNAGRCCGKARDEAVDDVAFARAVVAWVQQHYTVTAGRVYAVGMSNGGMMAYRLACEAADVFAGIASVAGTDNTLACQPARPLAVLHIHARDDDHVLFDGGAGPGAFRDERKVTDFTSVPATMAQWQVHNQCRPQPVRSLTVAGAYCERYTGCAAGSPLQLCVTEQGGHSWPGGGRTRIGKAGPGQALDANDVMWAFFSGLPPRP